MYTSVYGSHGLRAAPKGSRFSGSSSCSQEMLGDDAVGETPMGAAGRMRGQRARQPMRATAFCPVSGNFSYKPLSLTYQRNTVILSLLDLNLTPTLCFNIPDGGDLENPPPGTLYPHPQPASGEQRWEGQLCGHLLTSGKSVCFQFWRKGKTKTWTLYIKVLQENFSLLEVTHSRQSQVS